MTPLAQLLAGATTTLDVPPDWLQGRSIFGGLQVAFAVRAMRTLVPDAPLRTVQATFIGPSIGPLVAVPTILRRGGSAIHVEVRLVAGDATIAIVIGVFGTARRSVVAVMPVQQPVDRARPFVLPYLAGIVPAFLQHYRATLLVGVPPYMGGTGVDYVVELEMIDEPGRATESAVIGYADYVPPIGLTHLSMPAAGSTLTWMLELEVDTFDQFPLAIWRVDATLVAARDGYTSQAVRLWAPDGTLVAIGHQSMVVFG